MEFRERTGNKVNDGFEWYCKIQSSVKEDTHRVFRSVRKSFPPNVAVLIVYVAIQPEVRFIAKQNFAYENPEQRQSRFGPIRRIYAFLDDRFDELPNQTENKIT
ncbi:hypothetical protein TNCV_1079081 [Trichonephila clavipes]|nr:hypothetical protein TNCV_1079081 [Trichonephila clavipes]